MERGIVSQVNSFTVETKGAGTGELGLAVEGPSEAKMTYKDNRDGSCTVEYVPSESGEYDIAINFAGKSIPGSPFKVPVDKVADAGKVTASGPGVDPNHCRAGVPLPFTVNAKGSGKAPLTVEVKTEKGPIPQKPEIKDKGDGTYDVSYIGPPEGSQCNVKVAYGGKDIKGR